MPNEGCITRHRPSARKVALGDFNQGGKPDIVASSYADGNVVVYLNTTK